MIPYWGDHRGGSPLASHYGIKRPKLEPATQSWTKGFLLETKGESIYSSSYILAEGLMDQKIRIITGNSKWDKGFALGIKRAWQSISPLASYFGRKVEGSDFKGPE